MTKIWRLRFDGGDFIHIEVGKLEVFFEEMAIQGKLKNRQVMAIELKELY